MANVFNFFIKNKCVEYHDPRSKKKTLNPWTLYFTAENLKVLFDAICKSAQGFSHSEYHWNFRGADVKPHELLIYILPFRRSSLILQQVSKDRNASLEQMRKDQINKNEIQDMDRVLTKNMNRIAGLIDTHAGATSKLDCGFLSEVYLEEGVLSLLSQADLSNTKVDVVARVMSQLIFHEFMHNKLDADPDSPLVKDIHKGGGGGLAEENLHNPRLIAPADALTSRNVRLMAMGLGRKNPQCISPL